jgi:hypothetical protein
MSSRRVRRLLRVVTISRQHQHTTRSVAILYVKSWRQRRSVGSRRDSRDSNCSSGLRAQ